MKRMHALAALAAGPALGLASLATADAMITVPGTGGAIPDGDSLGTTFTVAVPNLGPGEVLDTVSISLDIDHTWVGDLIVTLQGPGGEIIDVMDRTGPGGFGYGSDLDSTGLLGTYDFADGGGDWWTVAATDPVATGTYAPSDATGAMTSFGATFTGAPYEGVWTLFISDNAGADTGTLNAWSLTVSTTVPLFDAFVTPDVIFGSGNANGGFTVDRAGSLELGMRAKLRFDASGFPQNVFNSNGDGTYTYNTGSGGPVGTSEWAVEWAVNTDYDDSSGDKVGDLTYEIGMDNDPGQGTDYLVFNNINPGFAIPYVPASPPVPAWDHAMGDNTTPNGGGVSTTDPVIYAGNLATLNVAQNSWQPTFFQLRYPANPLDTGAAITWDPDVPGTYDYYLKAFDGGVEVASTAITIIAVDGATMSLEADPCQTDVDPVKAGIQVAVDLWLRNPDDEEVTGWVAFLDYDAVNLTYEGACSSYGPGPFTGHFQPIGTADMVVPGQLWLDGNTFDTSAGTTDDELLATLVFTIGATCTPTASPAVSFDPISAFPSTLSFSGIPIATSLLDSGSIIVDDGDPPMITCPANITQPADAGVGDGCVGAVVTWADPVATDTCTAVSVVCTPASGSFFPVGITTVTCTATDACGNTSSCTFDVEVTETNLVCLDIQLDVSLPATSATRCIHFVLDDCTTVVDIPLTFNSSGLFSGEIEVPCPVPGDPFYSAICAKDEQHTQWANGDLVLSMDGTKYELSMGTPLLDLLAGDTDNDGDVDINDVTLLLAQFGTTEPLGGCPWNGMRGADFDNNGAVGSTDYTILSPQWLTTSECDPCPMPFTASKPEGKPVPRMSIPTTQLDWSVAQKADLNKDGMVDHRDVRAFELREGLPDTLSTSMLLGDLQYRRDQQRRRGR